MKEITLIEISFLNSLDIIERNDIEHQILKSHLAPDLDIEITFESFNEFGNYPCFINK